MSNPSEINLTIGVVGLGHVGLPTGLGLCEVGWDVVGFEHDGAKRLSIAAGKSPYFEPGLDDLLSRHLDSGSFRISESLKELVDRCTVIFVCVGTPQGPSGDSDLTALENVTRDIAKLIGDYRLIVEKSTVPVLTIEELRKTAQRYAPAGSDFDVAVNPEFLQEGTAVRDFLNPDRVVIGVDSPRSQDLLTKIYRPLLKAARPDDPDPLSRLIVTDLATAELIKHASNAFLAMRLSFINMIADLCEVVGADVRKVAHGMGTDPRIGTSFFSAGVGFGGYCLPKDLVAFARIGEKNGVDMGLLTQVAAVNDSRSEAFVDKVRRALWVIKGKKIAVWGLAFKPNTDDVRDAPSFKIISKLRSEGAKLRLYDPMANEEFKMLVPEAGDDVRYFSSAMSAAEGAEAVLVITEWEEFGAVDFAELKESMAVPVIIDGRNCIDDVTANNFGFEYHGTGR